MTKVTERLELVKMGPKGVMAPEKRFALRKNLLRLFIAFLAITAAYAVGVSLFGDWHDTQNRVIGSCTTITVGSLFGMSCAAFGEKRRAAILGVDRGPALSCGNGRNPPHGLGVHRSFGRAKRP